MIKTESDNHSDSNDARPPGAANNKRVRASRRLRQSPSLAEMLHRALDMPAAEAGDGTRRRTTRREAMIEALVARSAEADLAATRLLFELLRKADPRGFAGAAATRALGQDAVALLKERLERLARAQAQQPPRGPAAEPPAADTADAAASTDAQAARAAAKTTGICSCGATQQAAAPSPAQTPLGDDLSEIA